MDDLSFPTSQSWFGRYTLREEDLEDTRVRRRRRGDLPFSSRHRQDYFFFFFAMVPMLRRACGRTMTTTRHPTTNGSVQNGSSVGICTRCIHVSARFGVDLHARSVLVKKNSASELSRKFIKSVLLVGEGSVPSPPPPPGGQLWRHPHLHLFFLSVVTYREG